jgi:hypothetical protein
MGTFALLILVCFALFILAVNKRTAGHRAAEDLLRPDVKRARRRLKRLMHRAASRRASASECSAV